MEHGKINISDSFFPSFGGLKVNDKEILKDNQKIAN